MKVATGLYIFFIAMYLINLGHITLFNGEWNGIVMWLNTILFIASTSYYLLNKRDHKKVERK